MHASAASGGRSLLQNSQLGRRSRANDCLLPRTFGPFSLILTRPWWHGNRDRLQRRWANREELERDGRRDGHADTGCQRREGLVAAGPAPHFTAAGKDVPDLLDVAVTHGARSLPSRKPEGRHAAAAPRKQHTHFRTVRSKQGEVARECSGCTDVHWSPSHQGGRLARWTLRCEAGARREARLTSQGGAVVTR